MADNVQIVNAPDWPSGEQPQRKRRGRKPKQTPQAPALKLPAELDNAPQPFRELCALYCSPLVLRGVCLVWKLRELVRKLAAPLLAAE